jgi:hypothetical protein
VTAPARRRRATVGSTRQWCYRCGASYPHRIELTYRGGLLGGLRRGGRGAPPAERRNSEPGLHKWPRRRRWARGAPTRDPGDQAT